ncbi:MAG: response regulator [Treponema sp.]|jgi:signal transduction histidine kinase/HAMP domain-containing protein/DNA-binding NarL/FixJ family response regulator/HPt (histidine-containing phosphotransfer) domain-containing protein|nr:response regulator [Treponema sp.]
MKWYNDLKIRYKLLFTFGIPVFLLVVLAILASVQLGSIDKKYTNLISASIWRQNSISKAVADMQRLRYINLTKEYLVKTNASKDEFLSLQDKFNTLAEQFIEHLNAYRTNLRMDSSLPELEKEKRLEFIDETLYIFIHEYQAKTNELDASLFADEQESGRITRELFEAGEIISEKLDSFYRLISFMVQEVSTVTSANSHRAIILLTNMTIILVILSVLVSLFMSRTIKTPITRMEDAMQKISSGNLSYPIRSDHNDELGMLANQIGNMVDNISEMNKVMTVMANMDSMVIVTDLDYNLKYINKSCADILGVDINACKGKKCYKALRNLDSPCSICQMPHLLPQKDSYPIRDYEFLYDDTIGAWVGGKSAIIRWVDGSMAYLQSLKNETEKKKNQEQLCEAKKAAEEALAAKSVFFANMSHEIRTPMNAVLGMSELLLQENLSKRQMRYVNDIKMSAGALLNIINDILDVSKLQAGKLQLIPVHFDFDAMIDNINSIAHFLVEDSRKNIVFNLLLEKQEPLCLYGDDMRMRQVLLNLISNAIKFTEEGRIQLAVNFTDTDIHITVSDTGIGIPSASIPTLFDAFEQVDVLKNRGQKGTGLGLTITKAIVEMMCGRITIESEYGRGTIFHVEIPKVLGDPAFVEHINSKEVALCAPDAKILVVDDNETNLNVACGLLELFQITADTATSGRRAINLIQRNHYDIVFMDHRMPEMSGVETTKFIRGMGIDVPIIALTASAVVGAKDMMLEAGMNDYLWKPIVKTELVHMLNKWIPAEKLLVPPPETPALNDAGNEEDEYNSASKEAAVSKEAGELWKRLEYIEGLNLSIGLGRVDGKKNVYEKSLKYMIQEIEKNDKNLNAFLAANDMEQFNIAAHGMKGSLANIGAMELSSRALALEKASNTRDVDFCAANLPPFLEELNALCGKLKEAFSVICQRSEPIQIPPELTCIFERLIKAFGEFNLLRIEKEVAALDALHLSGALKEEVERIKDSVMIMDYNGAAELIRNAA